MVKENLEELFDTRTVSRHFGISRQTLDKERRRGAISFYPIGPGGTQIRYSRRQILDYLAKVEQTGASSVKPAQPDSRESKEAA